MTEDDTTDLQAERKARQAHLRELLAHPDPRDPDYPEIEGEDE